MGDDGGKLAFGVSSPEKDGAGRGRAMHPGWWGFFGLLGVLVVVGLVVSIVQGGWLFFGVIVVGCVLVGAWGLWEARLRPDWRRVELSDVVPSDAGERAAAVERIREARAKDRGFGWGGVVVLLVCVAVLLIKMERWWGDVWSSAAIMVVSVGLVWGLLLVSRVVWGRLSSGRAMGAAADGARGGGDGAGEAGAEEEEARLLASASSAAIHASNVRGWIMTLVVVALFMIIMSAVALVADWLGLRVSERQVEAARRMWMIFVVGPFLFVAIVLAAYTDGARRSAVRESRQLLYGEAARVPKWRRGREEMEALVRAHREGGRRDG